MATPRHKLVDQSMPLFYHLVSRCVRQSWLCGRNKATKRNYNHRKVWVEERLRHLAQAFAIEIHAYAVMSNHFHLVVYYDPVACTHWSDEEVADRWLTVCPPKSVNGKTDEDLRQFRHDLLISNPQQLAHARAQLGSLSAFMKHLKQPLARRANREDNCKGHFFEQRFYSGALLSEAAVVAAMAYVDLNPIRAKIANSLKACSLTSISARLAELENNPERLKIAITPLVSGLEKHLAHDFRKLSTPRLKITIGQYIDRLEEILGNSAKRKDSRWQAQVKLLKEKQRAFGSIDQIRSWIEQRGMQLREAPLP